VFNFNLKGTAISLAIRWEKLPFFRWSRYLRKLFLFLFILIFLIFLYGFLPEEFSKETSKSLLGLSIIFLSLCLLFRIIEGFVNLKLKKPRLRFKGFGGQAELLKDAALNPEKYNLAEFLSFEVARAVKKSLKSARSQKISSTHLFYHLLTDNPKLDSIFLRLLLNIKEVKQTLKREMKMFFAQRDSAVFETSFQDVILEALKIAQKKNHSRIEIGDTLAALAYHDLFFKRILIHSRLRTRDIENLTWLFEEIEEKIKKRKRFWEYENLAKRGTLAKEWTAGYTITLDKFSRDLTDYIKGATPEFIAHVEETKIAERALARREINNVLIVGNPGSGRKSIVYSLAQKSLLGKSLAGVNYKRVVQLEMAALLAQSESIEEVESFLDKIFGEAVLAGNIILVIDEFHNYIGQVSKPGIVDISGIITPYLRLPQFQIVAITTYDGLHRHIEKNPSVLSLFEKVEVSEVSPEITLLILETLVPILEKKHKIFISYPAIREIISLSERYLAALSFPEKAMDILDEVAIYVATATKEKVVLPKHVAEIITQKTEIPVGEIEVKEREILLNLEDLIHQRIINQDVAVKEVAAALRRARSDITVRKGPMGVFLFLGPTGVGKTETSKALAQFYFGAENRMIRLDMSEFQTVKDIPRLIGSEKEIGLLTKPVQETPFSLVLLDEIEKTHPNILNLFLQVFDEGYITDGFGKKVDFKNTIIIATSNAGYKVILEALKELTEWAGVKQKLLNFLFQKGIFRPEFINRFDAVVVFRSLTKENLLDIAELMLEKLKRNLKEKGVEFIITESLKKKIVELGYNPVFGAREMRRVIQDKVENVLASALLSKSLMQGNKVEINPENFKLIINSK